MRRFLQVAFLSSFFLKILMSYPFSPYELMKFKVRWLFIHAGMAEIEFKESNEEKGIYHIRLKAESSGIISSIFDVDDQAECWVDSNICSIRYLKNQREGRWIADENAEFDYKRRKIFYEIKKKKKPGEIEERKDEIEIGEGECFHDMVSSFYYFRILDIAEGKTYQIATFDRGKTFNTELKIIGREKISTELGEFDAFVLQPLSKFEGAFRTRKGKMWVWISADERKVPLRIKGKFTFGSVYMDIVYYQRGEVILTPQKRGLP